MSERWRPNILQVNEKKAKGNAGVCFSFRFFFPKEIGGFPSLCFGNSKASCSPKWIPQRSCSKTKSLPTQSQQSLETGKKLAPD